MDTNSRKAIGIVIFSLKNHRPTCMNSTVMPTLKVIFTMREITEKKLIY